MRKTQICGSSTILSLFIHLISSHLISLLKFRQPEKKDRIMGLPQHTHTPNVKETEEEDEMESKM